MVNIIGRKIIMQEDSNSAFRIILKDHKGDEITLTDTDVITLRMKYSMESNATLKKTAEVVTLDDKVYHIFRFSPSDTVNLPEGNYYYDVILENERKRFTIVPKSILSLEKPVALGDTIDEDELLILDSDGIDYSSIISSTPLVGIFNAVYYEGNKRISSTNISNTVAEVDDIIEF